MLSLMAIVFAALLGVDIMIKQHVEENMNPGETRELFDGKLIIRKAYNRGFLLNMLDNHPAVIRKATILTSIGILVWDVLIFMKKGHFVKKLGMVLLSAGAASNAFDRLARGKVIDYIGIRSKKQFLARITANLGDIYIACGGILVMAGDLLRRRIP